MESKRWQDNTEKPLRRPLQPSKIARVTQIKMTVEMEGNNGILEIIYFFQFKTIFLNKISLRTIFDLESALGMGKILH